MFAVWEYEADIIKAFDLIIKLFIRSGGSDIVWKVIPQEGANGVSS